jgi:glycosyltransferase involved in cell wall biosynthesis
MRILHITKKYPPVLGGDATYVAELEKQQLLSGHEVFIIAANSRESRNKKSSLFTFGILDYSRNLDRVNLKRVISLVIFAFSAFSIVKKIRPAAIHVHSVDLGIIVSIVGLVLGIPVFITCHSVLFPYKREFPVRGELDYFLLKAARYSKIITVDSSSLSAFKSKGFRNYLFLPVGVAVEEFPEKEKSGRPAVKEQPRIIFVGRLEKVKGLDVLLSAARIIHEDGVDFQLLIVGEGSYEPALRGICRQYGLESCVSFLGPVYDRNKLISLYLSADIFVLPSLREWCPVVLFEAWAAELAVIATKTGSIPDIAEDMQNCILVPPQDVFSLSLALRRLLSDETTRQSLAEQGRRLVEREFSWKVLAKKLERIYQGNG